MTREKMIKELTRNDLQWLISNPEEIEDAVKFYAEGGFCTWSNEWLKAKHERDMKEEA